MNDKEKEIVQAAFKKATAANDTTEQARLLGAVYDKELPVPSVIEAVSDVQRVDEGEKVYYLTPTDPSEKIFTISANCTITENAMSPSTQSELSFTDLISDERYICLHDWIKAQHDVMKLNTDAILENMNRQEEYAVLQLISAAATSAGNTFTLDSGTTKFDFPKLVSMRKALLKYGRNLVLISGSNVTEDIDLLDYDSNKFRNHPIDRVVSTHIPIEAYNVNIDSSNTDVISSDVAYLVAVSDSAARKPILFARRRTAMLTSLMNVTQETKERVFWVSPPNNTRTSTRKGDVGVTGFGEYGGVVLNTATCAKFTRT